MIVDNKLQRMHVKPGNQQSRDDHDVTPSDSDMDDDDADIDDVDDEVMMIRHRCALSYKTGAVLRCVCTVTTRFDTNSKEAPSGARLLSVNFCIFRFCFRATTHWRKAKLWTRRRKVKWR